jgi:hypothetical protein
MQRWSLHFHHGPTAHRQISPALLLQVSRLFSDASDNPKEQHPSLAADFIIEVQSARLNPIELDPPRAHCVQGQAEEKLDDVSSETNKEESHDDEEKDTDEDYSMYDYSKDFIGLICQSPSKALATRAFSTFVKLRNDLLRAQGR